jgi:disulfide bond formation protein DsbB
MDDRPSGLRLDRAADAAIAGARTDPGGVAALLAGLGSAATVAAAYVAQYGFGIAPCPLCLEQRKVHYVAIPLAVAVAVAAWKRAPRWLVTAGLAVLVIVFLVGLGVGVYHAGVEWKFWPGPRDCSGPITSFSTGGDLLSQMRTTSVVRCDEVQFRFLGLSLAGWNAVISLALAGVTGWGLSRRRAA